MTPFRFYYPIQVRYGDIDAQGHVNNARTVSFLEQARFMYLIETGLWDGKSFIDLGWIVADLHLTYLAPIFLRQKVRVGARAARLGNKSMTYEYLIEDETTGQALAKAETVMVAFDYHTQKSMPIPAAWREKILQYEGAGNVAQS